MKVSYGFWSRGWRALTTSAVMAAAVVLGAGDSTFGQISIGGGGGGGGRGGGGQGGGQGGARVGGQGGGGVRVGGQGGGVRVGGQGGARVTAPPAGARVGGQGGANVRAGGQGPAVRAGGQAAGGANLNLPGVGNAATRAVDGTANTVRRVPADVGNAAGNAANTVGDAANAAGNAAARATAPATGAIWGGANAATSRGANAAGRAAAGATVDALGTRANANVNAGARSRWQNLDPTQRAAFRSGYQAALRSNRNNVGLGNWLSANPSRANYWNTWGSGVRSGFYYGGNPWFGGSPFYTGNFWSGRNLIGLGLASAGYPGAGSAVAGYPIGAGYGGYGGWWGYQPWSNAYPWSYWWNRPSWNSVYAWYPNYGWNTPYFYDYGPGGNVVYTGNQVRVNGEVVGTPASYSASAAELAHVDPSEIGQTKPEEWMPLGTFSFALSADEQNPPRVIQLAAHKKGYISGTVYNRNSDKLYTVQGRIDPETQRVAFTVGSDLDTIYETGMYNLTQDQTPVLVHYGNNQTTTYLFARLEAPQTETEGNATTQSAAAPMPEVAR